MCTSTLSTASTGTCRAACAARPVLRRPRHLQKGEEVQGCHEPIIDPDLVDRAQDILSSRSTAASRSSNTSSGDLKGRIADLARGTTVAHPPPWFLVVIPRLFTAGQLRLSPPGEVSEEPFRALLSTRRTQQTRTPSEPWPPIVPVPPGAAQLAIQLPLPTAVTAPVSGFGA